MKLNRAVFKYIEHELYNYNDTKKEIEIAKQDIADESPEPSDGQPKALNKISDTTFNKTSRIMTNKYICRMDRTINSIDLTLKQLSDVHNQLFHLKYEQALPWQQVCDTIPMSERSYFYIRKELVEKVAENLGLLN